MCIIINTTHYMQNKVVRQCNNKCLISKKEEGSSKTNDKKYTQITVA